MSSQIFFLLYYLGEELVAGGFTGEGVDGDIHENWVLCGEISAPHTDQVIVSIINSHANVEMLGI